MRLPPTWSRRRKGPAVTPTTYPPSRAGDVGCQPIPPGLLDGPAALLSVLPNQGAGVERRMGPSRPMRLPRVHFRLPSGMAPNDHPNTRSSSARWEFRRVKIASAPKGPTRQSAQQPSRWFGLAYRPPRDPLHMSVVYRGGPECWYEVHARGRVGRFPGYVALHDAMIEIYGERRSQG